IPVGGPLPALEALAVEQWDEALLTIGRFVGGLNGNAGRCQANKCHGGPPELSAHSKSPRYRKLMGVTVLTIADARQSRKRQARGQPAVTGPFRPAAWAA